MDPTPVFDDLVQRYAEFGRHYHCWSHLTRCLREFDRVAGRMESPDAVELALWFHDAVYVPGDANNELHSADLFSRWSNSRFPPALVKKICELILITRHRYPPQTGDESYVVDIDLSSFGLDWPDFLQDSMNVRKEQSHVQDAVYHQNHAKFLNMLLSRPRIFHTNFFQERYEEPARRNIERLLAANRILEAHA